jgi:hypothetical protein
MTRQRKYKLLSGHAKCLPTLRQATESPIGLPVPDNRMDTSSLPVAMGDGLVASQRTV